MEVIKIQILLLKIKFNIYYEKKPSSSGTSGLRKTFSLSKTFHEFGLIEGSRAHGHMGTWKFMMKKFFGNLRFFFSTSKQVVTCHLVTSG